ncbi:hypothetical protein F511_11106 [Dorcoceras hygrometricum]|uniref:Uncharacterized protein n=1 Tax=Dorcoceras hygrometricum TaxID=472368 RepID=A0A2Z7C5K7_9LAMI|nr:hypothetical protein F511_11106 [Dorcoceras hygrometricum]
MVAVAQEAVPIQIIAPIPVAPAEEPIEEESREATSAVPIDEEISAEEQSAVEVAAATGVQEPVVEHVYEQVAETTADKETAVKDVLAETIHIGSDGEEQDVDTSDVGVVTPSDTDEEMESNDVGTDFGDQQLQTDVAADSRTDVAAVLFVEESVDDVEVTADEQAVGERTDADEARSLEDIILSIPVDVPLPSACVEITKITLGKDIKIPGFDERTWYLASLPQIPVDDKGKEPLLVKDPINGKPPQEHYSLICADIDLLVQLRELVIDEVDRFFNSFSFKKLPTIKVEDISEKEDQVLYWGETDSTRVALNRKVFILLKYRELLVRKFLESWKLNFVPGEGTSATDLKVIDMLSDLHLFLLEELKQQTLAHGLRWDRACCSQIFEGRLRPRGAVMALPDFEVERQRSYDDTLPPMSEFFKLMKKRWGDVCLEVAEFCASKKLLPVGSINFCRFLSVVEPVYSFVSRQPTVFALRLSQFCAVFVHISLFNGLSAANSRATATPDVTKALAQLRASIEQIKGRDDGGKLRDTLLLHFHDIENRFTACFDEQDRVLGVLRKDSHNQKHLLSLDIKSSQKQLSAQAATAAIDVVDVRREVKELNAKVTYLDGQVAATRNDLLEFCATAQEFSGSMSREGRGRGRSGERRSSGNMSGYSKRRRHDSGGPFRRSFEYWLG